MRKKISQLFRKNRITFLVKKEFLQIKRDKRLLPTIIILPIMQLLLFGYVVSTDVKHLATAICDFDRSAASRQILSSFSNSEYFDFKYYVKSQREIKDLIDEGKARIGIVIPPNFSKKVALGETAHLQIIVDGSDSSSANLALTYASKIIRAESGKVSQELLSKMVVQKPIPNLSPQLRIWYNPNLKSVNFMVPGLMATILMQITLIQIAIAIVKEKELGTLEQLIVTPIKRVEFILGKAIPYALIGFCDVVLIILVGLFWFKVIFQGSLILLLFLSLIFVFANIAVGIFISTISKTQQQAMSTAVFITMPSIMISGFIFPVENMPKVIQYLVYLIPLKYFLIIVRGIFLKGIGLKTLWPQVTPLLILALVMLTLSTRRFQKKLSD